MICVGNLTAGGAGKTPTVIALVERLAARGVAAHIVSRGHGGSLAGPVRVEERRHRAAEVGDEPLLLAAFAPVWVARDRAAAGRAAEAAGAAAVVMDDGLQNPDLAKDLSVVVVDAGFGFGNGRVIPAGPLREPVAEGLARADLAPRHRPAGGAGALPAGLARAAAAGARRRAAAARGPAWPGAACARSPSPASAGRRSSSPPCAPSGSSWWRRAASPTMQPYEPRVLARLEAEAKAGHAQLVTTEKDAARLPPAFRAKVLVLPVRLELEDWGPLDAALARLGL